MLARLLTALALLVSASSVAAADLVGRASVIDADTIEIHGQRIRLHGIDAPESSQRCQDVDGGQYRCGKVAAFALADLIGPRVVRCRATDVDRYKRIVAVCRLGQTDLNEWLVREGYAVAYRRYSLDYVAAEHEARAHRRGLWSGRFVMPWDWRRGERLP